MQVIEQSLSEQSNAFRNDLPSLITQVGSSTFEKTLSEVVQSTFGCQQLTAFSFSEAMEPSLVSIIARNRIEAVKSASVHYSRVYWKLDPSNIFSQPNTRERSHYGILLEPSHSMDQDFRRDCYTLTGVSQRLSFLTKSGKDWVKLSLHRPESLGSFDDATISALMTYGDTIVSLLLGHKELVEERNRTKKDPRYFEEILAANYPSLTKRERTVCSMIAIGMGSEAIALTLDVSINTILTFRRRAYARLGISSQNELLRLLYDQAVM